MNQVVRHRVIRASAGTGKTYQLAHQFLQCLGEETSPDQILATTFTRKAAGEILDRVLTRLAEIVDDASERACVAEAIGIPTLSSDDCLQMLRKLVRRLHRLRVGTLDSFFIQIAQCHSLELGLPPGWRIMSYLEDVRIRDEAVDALLRNNDVDSLLTLMHLLTKGETTRSVRQLMRDTVDNLYGIFLDTEPEAWRQFPKLTVLDSSQLAAAIEQLEQVPVPDNKRFQKARAEDVEAASLDDWDSFLGKGLSGKLAAGEHLFYRKEIPEDLRSAYQPLLAHAKAINVYVLQRQTEATYDLLSQFDVEYRRIKYENRVLRFEDVTRQVAEENSLDGKSLAFRMDGAIESLLLDEFQDTSLPQWNVVQPFAQRVTAADSPGRFFCVGDVKQAIYGWRGGVAEIFDTLEGSLQGLHMESLDRSYRSAQPVIDTVNQVFSRLDRHGDLDGIEDAVRDWSQRFSPHTTARADLQGYACLLTGPAPAEERTSAVERRAALLEYTAVHVSQLVQDAPGRSIGILLRTNASVGNLIYELRKLGVHASEEGGNPLTDSAAVQVVLAALQMADHPGDTTSRYRVVHSGLGELLGLTSYDDNELAASVAAEIRRALSELGYGAVLDVWVHTLANDCDRRELSRLEQLVEMAYLYDPRATLRCVDFVEWIRNEPVSDPTSADVRVMTIHQSKGLQFDAVILPELESSLTGQAGNFVVHRNSPVSPAEIVCRYVNKNVQQLLPPKFRKMFAEAKDASVQESLCVLYVALTRAKHALHMLILSPSESEKKLPSTFAGLLRTSLHEKGDGGPESVLFEIGDPLWYQQGASPVDAEPVEDPEMLSLKLAPANATGRGVERFSPSGLEGERIVSLSSAFTSEFNSEAMDRGTLIHAWFEEIAWREDGLPSNERLQQIADRLRIQNLNLIIQQQQFAEMLEHDAIAALLEREAYADLLRFGISSLDDVRLEVSNEHTFAVLDQGAILSGSIDRLVLIYAGDKVVAADVLDYKTDTLDAADSAAVGHKVKFYSGQIEAYKRAVATMYKLPPERVCGSLVFVSPGLVCEVSFPLKS